MFDWLCTELCATIARFSDYQTRLCLGGVNRFWRELVNRELTLTMTKSRFTMNRYQAFFVDNLSHRNEEAASLIVCVGHGNMGKRTAVVQAMLAGGINVVVWTHRPDDALWNSFVVEPTSKKSKRTEGEEVYTIDVPSLLIMDIRQFVSSISVNPDGAMSHLIDADPKHIDHLDIVLPALMNLRTPIRICARRADWIMDRYRQLGTFQTLMPTYVGEIVHNTTGPKVPLSYQFLWDKFNRAMKIVTNIRDKDSRRSFTLLCASRSNASSMAKWLRTLAPDMSKTKSRRSIAYPQSSGPSLVISTIRAAVAQTSIDTSDIVYVDSPKTSTMSKIESKLDFSTHRVVHFWYVCPDATSLGNKKVWKAAQIREPSRKSPRRKVAF